MVRCSSAIPARLSDKRRSSAANGKDGLAAVLLSDEGTCTIQECSGLRPGTQFLCNIDRRKRNDGGSTVTTERRDNFLTDLTCLVPFYSRNKENLKFCHININTVKPVFTTTCEIGTTWELRTTTSVPQSIQYMEMDLTNKTTSEFRTVLDSPLGVPNSQVPL